jgi:hypothetical protein
MNDEDIISQAQAMYCDDDIEIDDEPKLSHAEQGCWVQAWVWVPLDEEE